MRKFRHCCQLAALGLMLALGVRAQVVTLYPNQDFEAAELGLGLWPTNTESTLHLDRSIVFSGQQALRIDSPDAGQRAFATMNTHPEPGVMPPDSFFTISLMVRKSPGIDNRAITFRINFRTPPGQGQQEPGKNNLTAMPLRRKITPHPNGWEQWTGYFKVPEGDHTWQFLLGVEHAEGSVWFDQIVFEKIDPRWQKPDVWTNWTLGVETGPPPLKRWEAHNKARGTLYHAARRYNALLWQSAQIEAWLRAAERAATYTARPLPTTLQNAAATEAMLQNLFSAFDDAFVSGRQEDWDRFAQTAAHMEQTLHSLNAGFEAFWAALPDAGLPPHFGRQPRSLPALTADGRLNRLLFGAWSPLQFSETEAPFEFEFHSVAPGHPLTHTETTRDFSAITTACDNLSALGYAGTFGYLLFGLHDQIYAPAWFYDKHRGDPDFVRTSWDGHPGKHRSATSYCLNFFHPAVKEYISDYVQAYAAYGAREPRLLFYEFAAETLTNFTTEAGLRSIGYGRHATLAFQEHLRRRYPDITAVNAALATSFTDFSTAEQPPDPLARKRASVTPLDAEYELFRENSYMDYLRSIHQAIKTGDPAKPTVARFSGLISDMNGARIFEVCDIVSHHCRAPRMQMVYPYLNSMNRHYRRGLAYMEDFWGCQEAQDRIEDERAQRRGLEKHLARSLIWGRTLQMKWYSYTSAPYIFTYNGNWLSLRHDLTTMRYATPALGLTLRQLEQFDWVLTHSTLAPGRILLLHPSAAMRNLRPSAAIAGDLQKFHNTLQEKGFFYESLPEEYLLDGRVALTSFDVVLLPRTPYLAHTLQASLANFVQAGGTLVAMADLPAADDLARPDNTLRHTLGDAKPVRTWQQDGQAWASETGHGRGRLIQFTASMPLAIPSQNAEFAAMLAERVQRTAWTEGDVLEVFLRQAEDGHDYLFMLNPDLDHPRTATLHCTVPCAELVDATLPGGVRIPSTLANGKRSASIRLAPAETAVLWLKR